MEESKEEICNEINEISGVWYCGPSREGGSL